ncbi:NAD(P)-dependent oxidoreductase [Fodinicurvata sp. EGI_FJ10296]|uniref:NAD-dependent epimerase/dehydratase family protein n=1 Tax=Fodinicurvata sp. EGI_FJ10296 TaxID=3231908 RepID=UPI00345437CD
MRVLVTGGTGFIGWHAVREMLAAGHEIILVTRHGFSGLSDPKLHILKGDLLETGDDLLSRVREAGADVLLMLAWETRHGKFWTASSNAAWCARSIQLAQAFLEGGGRRIVSAGTCVEYDAPATGPCVPDSTPLRALHPYSISKDSLRRMLEWMTAAYGASLAWGRIFLAYGPGEFSARLVPSVVNALLDGTQAKCSSGRQVRDFLHAEDYGRAFALLVASDVQGAVNVCSGKPATIGNVVEEIAAIIGRPHLIALGALPDREGEPANLWGDMARLARETGFTPKYSLPAGLKNTVEWWIETRRRGGQSTE